MPDALGVNLASSGYALSRSISTFTPEVFLAIVNRLSRNIAPVMTVLMPAALWSMVPVLFLSFNAAPRTFYLTSRIRLVPPRSSRNDDSWGSYRQTNHDMDDFHSTGQLEAAS